MGDGGQEEGLASTLRQIKIQIGTRIVNVNLNESEDEDVNKEKRKRRKPRNTFSLLYTSSLEFLRSRL